MPLKLPPPVAWNKCLSGLCGRHHQHGNLMSLELRQKGKKTTKKRGKNEENRQRSGCTNKQPCSLPGYFPSFLFFLAGLEEGVVGPQRVTNKEKYQAVCFSPFFSRHRHSLPWIIGSRNGSFDASGCSLVSSNKMRFSSWGRCLPTPWTAFMLFLLLFSPPAYWAGVLSTSVWLHIRNRFKGEMFSIHPAQDTFSWE